MDNIQLTLICDPPMRIGTNPPLPPYSHKAMDRGGEWTLHVIVFSLFKNKNIHVPFSFLSFLFANVGMVGETHARWEVWSQVGDMTWWGSWGSLMSVGMGTTSIWRVDMGMGPLSEENRRLVTGELVDFEK